MDVLVRIHEELLVDRHEVAGRVHARQHSEGVVHLGVQRIVLRLRVVVGLDVVVGIRVDGLGDVGCLIPVVDGDVLPDAENPVHVLLRNLVVWELEAELVVAEQRQLRVGSSLVLRASPSRLGNQPRDSFLRKVRWPTSAESCL